MNFDLKNKYDLHTYLGTIHDVNYFNDVHQVVRVRFDGKLFDFKYKGTGAIPHPDYHLALITATEETMNDIGLTIERQNLMPGIMNKFQEVAALPFGWVELLNRKQVSMFTNSQNGSSGFSIEESSMSNRDKLRIAITPPLNKDYTNDGSSQQSELNGKTSESKEDLGNSNFGIFMNDESIVIKAPGGQITMGKEGIHLGGNIMYESSEHVREWMFDNTLSRFIPSTIPTAILSIPALPNIEKFAKYAQVGQRIASIADKTSRAINIFRSM